jgi:hypothetical protein
MSTIRCAKCGAEISSLSSSCPSCKTAVPAGSAPPPKWNGLFTTSLDLMLDPRGTFEYIRKFPYGGETWALLFITAFLGFIDETLEDHKAFVNLILIPVTIIVGWVFLWIFGRLEYHYGKLLGGTGSREDLFEVQVWAMATTIPASLASIVGGLSSETFWHLIWVGIGVILLVWAIVVCIVMLATAHRYSIPRAIATTFLAFLTLVAPFIVAFVVVKAAGGF